MMIILDDTPTNLARQDKSKMSRGNNKSKSSGGGGSGSHRILRRRASTGEVFKNGVSSHQSSPTSVRDTKSMNSNSNAATSFDEAFKNGTILPYFLDTAVRSFDGLLQSGQHQAQHQQSSSSSSSSSSSPKRIRYKSSKRIRSYSLGDLTIHHHQQHDEIEIQQHSFNYDGAAAFDYDAMEVDADENDYNYQNEAASSFSLPALSSSFSFDEDSQQQEDSERIRHQRLQIPLRRIPLQHYDYEREYDGYQPLALWTMVRHNMKTIAISILILVLLASTSKNNLQSPKPKVRMYNTYLPCTASRSIHSFSSSSSSFSRKFMSFLGLHIALHTCLFVSIPSHSPPSQITTTPQPPSCVSYFQFA